MIMSKKQPYKEYHENGQLKLEAQFDENGNMKLIPIK